MKKSVLFACLFALSVFCFADEPDPRAWAVYSANMPKDAVGTLKIKFKIGTVFEAAYPESGSFTPAAADTARGFAVYNRILGEHIYPNVAPAKEEIKAPFAFKGTLGEFETHFLLVYPLKDLPEISVTAGELVSGENKIPASAFDLRSVLYDYEPEGPAWLCRAKYLMKGGKAKGLKEIPRPFTVTVRIPENAVPGEYAGKLNISAGGEKYEQPVKLTVLPFKFEPLTDDHVFFIFSTTTSKEPKQLDKLIDNLQAHGFNSYYLGEDQGSFYDFKSTPSKINIEAIRPVAEALKRHGVKKWIFECWPGQGIVDKLGCKKFDKVFDSEYISLMKQIKKAQVENDWPEIIMTYDEPREVELSGVNSWRAWNDINNYARLHALAGLEVAPGYMCDSGEKKRDDPSKEALYSDIVPMHKYTITHGWGPSKRIIENATKPGKVLWLYNNGYGRLPFGLLPVRYAALGQAQFWWQNGNKTLRSDPSFPLFNAVVQTSDYEFIEVLRYIESREGIDDYKYVWTLKKALEAAKDKNSTAAQQASLVLSEIMSMEFVGTAKGGAEGDTTSEFALKKYNTRWLMEIREKVIRSIIALKNY